MTEIMGKKPRGVNAMRKQRTAICMYRKISGKGCKGCSFCGVENLCIQPARANTAYEVISP